MVWIHLDTENYTFKSILLQKFRTLQNRSSCCSLNLLTEFLMRESHKKLDSHHEPLFLHTQEWVCQSLWNCCCQLSQQRLRSHKHVHSIGYLGKILVPVRKLNNDGLLYASPQIWAWFYSFETLYRHWRMGFPWTQWPEKIHSTILNTWWRLCSLPICSCPGQGSPRMKLIWFQRQLLHRRVQ